MGRVGDRDPAERAEIRQEIRIVEDRGDRLAPARLTREREVRDDHALALDQLRHLTQPHEPVPAPCRPVDDEAVRVRQQIEGRLALERRFARPPDRDRQVVDDQRRRDRRQVPAGLAAGDEVDRLGADFGGVGARHDAVRLDPPVEPRRPIRIGRLDDDGARWMAPGQELDRRSCRPRCRPSGPARPRSSSVRLRSRRCCGHALSSAGSADRA